MAHDGCLLNFCLTMNKEFGAHFQKQHIALFVHNNDHKETKEGQS
jgi:hypothetical protein